MSQAAGVQTVGKHLSQAPCPIKSTTFAHGMRDQHTLSLEHPMSREHIETVSVPLSPSTYSFLWALGLNFRVLNAPSTAFGR